MIDHGRKMFAVHGTPSSSAHCTRAFKKKRSGTAAAAPLLFFFPVRFLFPLLA
jgi:hypothetical protein